MERRKKDHRFHWPVTEMSCSRGSWVAMLRPLRLSERGNGDPESAGVCTPAKDSTESEGEEVMDGVRSSSISSSLSSDILSKYSSYDVHRLTDEPPRTLALNSLKIRLWPIRLGRST